MQKQKEKSRFEKCVEVAEKYNLPEIMASTFNSLKSYNRLFEKTMMLSRNGKEVHKTSRGIHTQQVAAEAAEMAKSNNLNVDFLRGSMNAHDIAHSFFGHQGGRIIASIACINNGTYFEHNSMGPRILIKEKFDEKVLYKIKKQSPQITTDELEKCEEYIYYFYDVILSHDGESKDLITIPQKTEDIKKTVRKKIQGAYSHNNHKTIATTLEGALGKMTDVITYLKTDFLDAFRNGIVDIYNEDYVEFLGKLFGDADIDIRTKKEFFQRGLNYIQEKIDEQNALNLLNFETQIDEQTKEHIKILVSAINLPGDGERFSKIIVKYIDKYRELNSHDPLINNKVDVINEYINKNKNTKIETEVIENIFTDVQLKFKKAISISEDENGDKRIKMREKEFKLYDELRRLDYIYIIPFSRRAYQNKVFPKAVNKATNKMAEKLIKTGIIKRFFEDPTIQKEINDPEMLKYMKISKRDYKEEQAYHKVIGVSVEEKSRFKKLIDKVFFPERTHFKKMYEDTLRNKRIFSEVYINSYLAIENRIKEKVDDAILSKKIEIPYLQKEYMQQLNEIRTEIADMYNTIEISQKQKEEYIKKKIEIERRNIEEIVAKNLVIEYIAGMTDMSVEKFCIDLKTTNWFKLGLNRKFTEPDDAVIRLRDELYGDTIKNVKKAEIEKENTKKKEYETKKSFKQRIKANSEKIDNPNTLEHIYKIYLKDEDFNQNR